MIPAAHAWPLQKECIAYYGNPALTPDWLHRNTVYVPCPWTLFVGAQPTNRILIHNLCAPSLARVLNNVWDAVGKNASQIKLKHYDKYDGSYNFRPMRGSAVLSMHSFACAIDWDAQDNPFHSSKHLFTDDDVLIVKFKEEGWVWGGDWSPGSQDAMHVQAARIHP